MSEVVTVTGVRQLIQDLVSPDLKAVKAKVDALEVQVGTSVELLSKQMDLQFTAMMTALDSFRAEMRSELSSLRSANKAEVTEHLAPIAERVARLEALIETRQ